MNLPVKGFLPAQPTSADGIKKSIAATPQLNERSRLNLLFDAANHPAGLDAVEQYVRRTSASIVNLLEHLPEGDSRDVGFYLVAIDAGQAEEVLEYWADPKIQPAGIWLWSQSDTPTLAAHLRQFILIQHQPKRSGLLRLADPHTWSALTNDLEGCVGQMLCSSLDVWWMADMDGQWYSSAPARRSSDKPATPMVLKEQHVAKLIDAMWPIQIYFALHPTSEELPNFGTRMTRLEAIRDEHARAKDWGGSDGRDFVMFSSLAEAFGTNFDKAPHIQQALKQGRDTRIKLADTLRSIPLEYWERV